jgi:hypothetical protein
MLSPTLLLGSYPTGVATDTIHSWAPRSICFVGSGDHKSNDPPVNQNSEDDR